MTNRHPAGDCAQATIIIAAGRRVSYWADLWQYRELFYFLALRDFLVRYKQTLLGITWAAIRPLLMMIVFTLIFGRLAGFPSEGLPYPVFVFAALLPWQLFAAGFSDGGSSLVNNASLISKVYFPRLVIPTSVLLVSMVDFAISLVVLAGLLCWYGVNPGWGIVAIPAFAIMAFATALSAAIWTAALNVRYRDVRFLIPFALQLGLYISPVGFASAMVPAEWRLLYSLNPVVGIIDGFRWAVSGGGAPLYLPGMALSALVTALLLVSGVSYFRRTESTFADVI